MLCDFTLPSRSFFLITIPYTRNFLILMDYWFCCDNKSVCVFPPFFQIPELQIWKDLLAQRYPAAILPQIHRSGHGDPLRAEIFHRGAKKPQIFSQSVTPATLQPDQPVPSRLLTLLPLVCFLKRKGEGQQGCWGKLRDGLMERRM